MGIFTGMQVMVDHFSFFCISHQRDVLPRGFLIPKIAPLRLFFKVKQFTISVYCTVYLVPYLLTFYKLVLAVLFSVEDP